MEFIAPSDIYDLVAFTEPKKVQPRVHIRKRTTIPMRLYGPDVAPEIAAEYTTYRHKFLMWLSSLVRTNVLTEEEKVDIQTAIQYANLEQLQSIDRNSIRSKKVTGKTLSAQMPTKYPY